MSQSEDFIFNLLSDKATKHKAFEIIVRTYSERIYNKIRYIVLSHDDANDVLQNTFMKAWNNIDSFNNKSKLLTWLYSIAINESFDYLRKNKKRIAAGSPDDISISEKLLADDYFDGNDAQALLFEAVATLPDVQRTVFNLKYFENMKYSEISYILNTSEGSLKASYHIAVKKITEYINAHE